MAYDAWGDSWGTAGVSSAWGLSWYHVAATVVIDGHDPGIRHRKKRIEDRERLREQIATAMGYPPELVAEVGAMLAPHRVPSDGRAQFVFRVDEAAVIAELSAKLDALAAKRQRIQDEEEEDELILLAIH